MAKISPVMWGECNYNYLNIFEHEYKQNVRHATKLCTPPKFYKIIFFRTCLSKVILEELQSLENSQILNPPPHQPTPSPSSPAGFGPSFAKGFNI